MTQLQTPGASAVASLGPWFHNLHLPDGTQTAPDHPLGDFPAYKWRELADALPADLSGARALEIGCNAGYYTFQLAARGADVLGIDHDEHYLRQARWAAAQYGVTERVEFRAMDVYDLAGLEEQFDLVLFMGVLYHLRHPLLALDIVAARTRGTLVLQTLTYDDPAYVEPPDDVPFEDRARLADEAWPKMAFVEKKLAGDHTNWWVPNAAAVEAMVRSTGMRVVARPGYQILLCEHAPEP